MRALSAARRLLTRIVRRFGFHPPAPVDPQDWQVGDIAECFTVEPWFRLSGQPAPGPQLGERNRVAELIPATCTCSGCKGRLYLRFSRYRTARYHSIQFRKVRPQADELVAAEPEALDRWIVAPEVKARLDAWHLRAQVAVLTAAALICTDSLIAALTRGPA